MGSRSPDPFWALNSAASQSAYTKVGFSVTYTYPIIYLKEYSYCFDPEYTVSAVQIDIYTVVFRD